jgi:uncharacterized membrane protein YbhN (UPF0104 family)
VSGGLLAVLAWQIDWALVGLSFSRLRLDLGLAAVLVFLVCQVISGVRWWLVARPLGFEQTPGQFVRYTFIALYFNLFLPTSFGGDVVRTWYLAGQSGRRGAATLTVLVDRLSGLMWLLLLAGVAATCCPMGLEAWILWTVYGAVACAAIAGGALMLLWRYAHWEGRVGQLLDQLGLWLRRPGLLVASSLLALLVQAGNVVIVWILGRALGMTIPASYYWIAVPMVALLTLLPVSINGLGVREGGMLLFFAPFGVESTTILSLTFLWFAVFVITGVVGGGVYLCSKADTPQAEPDDKAGTSNERDQEQHLRVA